MKQQTKLHRWILSALFGLILAGSTTLGLAQVTNNPNTFDDPTSIISATIWWGNVAISWDSTLDVATNSASGSMRYDSSFTGAAGEQFMTFISLGTNQTWDGSIRIDASTYTNVAFDIRVPPGTPPTISGNYGTLEVGFLTRNDSWVFGTIFLKNYTIPLSATNWTHVDTAFANNLPNLNFVCGWYFKMWSNGQYTNAAHFNFDNLAIQAPEVVVTNPPPVLSLQPTTPGLQLISTSLGGANARYGIHPVSPGYSFVGSAETTYSVTIKEYPDFSSYPNFQTHMFLIPSGSLPWGPNDSACDWNCTNMIFIQIADSANGGGYARFMWKTNVAGGGWGSSPQQIFGANVIQLGSTHVLGTWSLKIQNTTNFTWTAPDGSYTNFVFAPEAAAYFSDPTGLYAYFGMQPNGAANVGQSSVIGEIKITGGVDGSGTPSSDIDDIFATAPLDTATWAIAASDANGIQVVDSNTAFWLLWTLPDSGYAPQWSPDLPPSSGWMDPGLSAITLGTFKRALIPALLSSTNTAFFRLYDAVKDSPSQNIVTYQQFDLAQGTTNVVIPVIKAASFKIAQLFPLAPNAAKVTDPQSTNAYTALAGWQSPNEYLIPGSTYEFYNPDPAIWTIVFTGDVLGAAPAVLIPPLSQTVDVGDNATFTVYAAGNPTLQYQWQHAGTNLSGATGTSLNLTNIQMSQAGSYTVGLTNGSGGVVSSAAVLTVIDPSATLSSPALAGGFFSFQVSGLLYHLYVVEEAATIGGTWSPVYTNNGQATSFQVSRPAVSGENRFYRAVYKHQTVYP